MNRYLILFVITSFFLSCSSEEPDVFFQIGDTGPAGGIIFYDKGNDAVGWQYIEVSPVDLQGAQWGCANQPIEAARQAGIGLGLLNSESILSFHNNLDDYFNNPAVCGPLSDGTIAAKICLEYELNGFNDWHLPSLEEAELLYENLHLQGLGDFNTTKLYWTSTENDAETAPATNFSSGAQDAWCKACNEGDVTLIRPVRYF